MAGKSSTPVKLHMPAEKGNVQLFALEVFLMSGPISEKFANKNPVISRTIQIRGDQTLEDLHHTIFDAFGRWEEHMYEFQFGKGPMDPKAPRYVLANADEMDMGDDKRPAGRVVTINGKSYRLRNQARSDSPVPADEPESSNPAIPPTGSPAGGKRKKQASEPAEPCPS